MLSTGELAEIACIWEATARKPGNVHRYRDFGDCSYLDFLLSAAAGSRVLDGACNRPVGQTVLEAVRRSRQVAPTNTNLGILLLLAPLAATPNAELQTGVEEILVRLDREDARLVYQAIRLAHPGGLGRVSQEDVHDEPTQGLRQVMEMAADRDLIARQYANGFKEVFANGIPALACGLERAASLEDAIVYCHLDWMANFPDSLVQRKRGLAEAEESRRLAGRVLQAGWPREPKAEAELASLDSWLRACGNERNPGTTADLVAACLFAALRQGMIKLPLALPWSRSTGSL
jgi:triphosphoribosyl-dephospho-CoA synthase